MCYKSSMPMG